MDDPALFPTNGAVVIPTQRDLHMSIFKTRKPAGPARTYQCRSCGRKLTGFRLEALCPSCEYASRKR